MTLTDHQLKHLRVVRDEMIEIRNMPKKEREMMLKNRGVRSIDFLRHMDKVKDRVKEIIDSGIWPSRLKRPSHIHKFLERNWDV